jgi:hypothetical protein
MQKEPALSQFCGIATRQQPHFVPGVDELRRIELPKSAATNDGNERLWW